MYTDTQILLKHAYQLYKITNGETFHYLLELKLDIAFQVISITFSVSKIKPQQGTLKWGENLIHYQK